MARSLTLRRNRPISRTSRLKERGQRLHVTHRCLPNRFRLPFPLTPLRPACQVTPVHSPSALARVPSYACAFAVYFGPRAKLRLVHSRARLHTRHTPCLALFKQVPSVRSPSASARFPLENVCKRVTPEAPAVCVGSPAAFSARHRRRVVTPRCSLCRSWLASCEVRSVAWPVRTAVGACAKRGPTVAATSRLHQWSATMVGDGVLNVD
jgi:hypothetical protein